MNKLCLLFVALCFAAILGSCKEADKIAAEFYVFGVKSGYKLGEGIEPSELLIKDRLNEAFWADVTIEMIENFSTAAVGEFMGVIRYLGEKLEFNYVVTADENSGESNSISEPPVVPDYYIAGFLGEYLQNQVLNFEGLAIFDRNNTNIIVPITTDMLTNFSTAKVGDFVAFVTFDGREFSFNYKVLADYYLLGTKIEYSRGEEFNAAEIRFIDRNNLEIVLVPGRLELDSLVFETGTAGEGFVGSITFDGREFTFIYSVIILPEYYAFYERSVFALGEEIDIGMILIKDYNDDNFIVNTKESIGFDTNLPTNGVPRMATVTGGGISVSFEYEVNVIGSRYRLENAMLGLPVQNIDIYILDGSKARIYYFVDLAGIFGVFESYFYVIKEYEDKIALSFEDNFMGILNISISFQRGEISIYDGGVTELLESGAEVEVSYEPDFDFDAGQPWAGLGLLDHVFYVEEISRREYFYGEAVDFSELYIGTDFDLSGTVFVLVSGFTTNCVGVNTCIIYVEYEGTCIEIEFVYHVNVEGTVITAGEMSVSFISEEAATVTLEDGVPKEYSFVYEAAFILSLNGVCTYKIETDPAGVVTTITDLITNECYPAEVAKLKVK